MKKGTGTGVQWHDAIKACITEYDTNEKLREVLEKTDADYLPKHAGLDCSGGVYIPNRPEGFTDPVKDVHPPKAVLDSIRGALAKLAAADADATGRYRAARAAADNADSPYEQEQALKALTFATPDPERMAAIREKESVLSRAGVFALSLRSPFFTHEDLRRKSRSADEIEKKLFVAAWSLLQSYPARTRRLLHGAKNQEQQDHIKIQSGTECRAELAQRQKAAQKVQEERDIQRQKALRKANKQKGVVKQKAFSNPVHTFIAEKWPLYVDTRRSIGLKVLREGFVRNSKYNDDCVRLGINSGDDVRKIQDVLRKAKKTAEK
ncbi:MAG: hypothetical protein WCK89_06050 [bacterium]